MSASRFRPPKSHTPARNPQPRPGYGLAAERRDTKLGIYEREPTPVLRRSRTGICNLPRKARLALRKERKADPTGTGVHSWRRRQWN